VIYFQHDACQSGERWFWRIEQPDGTGEHGWANTEHAAMQAAKSKMRRITNGAPFTAEFRKGLAERKVKTARPVAETERARPQRPKKPRPTKADHELWK
jgi:hypothetical protein